MSEKVKLPKDVCDALEDVRKCMFNYSNSAVIVKTHKKEWTSKENKVLNEQDADIILRALVLGYEPELTAEEQLKFMLTKKHNKNIDYKCGAWYALKIHGIKYDWLEEYAE